jgi:hypothetical protein
MRDEASVRDEIQWLVERARIALGLPESALAGCTAEQIAQILGAQEVSELPPPLDELLRVAGVHANGTVLGELLRGTSLGWDVMLWLPAGEPDPPVWALTERTLAPGLQSARLGCWLEGHVVMADMGRPSPG